MCRLVTVTARAASAFLYTLRQRGRQTSSCCAISTQAFSQLTSTLKPWMSGMSGSCDDCAARGNPGAFHSEQVTLLKVTRGQSHWEEYVKNLTCAVDKVKLPFIYKSYKVLFVVPMRPLPSHQLSTWCAPSHFLCPQRQLGRIWCQKRPRIS